MASLPKASLRAIVAALAVGLLLLSLHQYRIFAQAAPSLTWTAPTTNVDGSPLVDLAGYEAAAAAPTADLNTGGFPATTLKVDASTRAVPLASLLTSVPDGDYSLWVRALDTSKNPSTWAGPIAHRKDTLPPGPPTNPRKTE